MAGGGWKERVRFLFDLRGYVIVRNVLSPDELSLANLAISSNSFHERLGDVRLAPDGSCFVGDENHGRLDLAGMLGWPSPHGDLFRKFLVHPNLIPYLHLLVGSAYRLDHSPLIIAQDQGSEGFSLHGGSIHSNGSLIPELQYICRNNTIVNTLIACSFQLTDHNPGDGGFCVVPGSHKINFTPLPSMMTGEDTEFFDNCLVQPVTKAGDVVIFSEATIHGCLPWKSPVQRRIALYRFAPCNMAYARGYSEGWPPEFTNGMTDDQLSVMQPPYHSMYDRISLVVDPLTKQISTQSKSRSESKKQFDLKVFGQQYY